MPEIVLVTEKEYGKGEALFRAAKDVVCLPVSPAEEALSAAVLNEPARAIIVGVQRYTGRLYEALHEVAGERLGLLARFGVGHDSIDKDLARAHGLVVANTPGALDVSVAEHTLWLMGALARHGSLLEARFRSGEFAGETGTELRGQCLGVLGLGQIGRRVAALAHFGFGMRVLGAGASSSEQLERREGASLSELKQRWGLELYTADADRLLAECDFLSVHLPAVPATRHFINRDRLAKMRRGAFLVNTARGSIVDEDALFDALTSGRLGGAGLDVFEHEPYWPVSPGKDLRHLPHVVLTPHIGSNTRQANRRMAELCLANVRHFLAGELDQVHLVPPAEQR